MIGESRKSLVKYGAVVVAATAAIARIAYLLKFRHNPFFDYYPKGFDQLLILKGALEIAAGNLLGPLSSEKHAVLYKYIIAIPFAIFGRNFWAVWCFQFGMGVLIALFTYWVGKRYFGQVTGLWAGLWYALYGPAFFFEGQILREELLTFFVILSVYFLVRTDFKPAPTEDAPKNQIASRPLLAPAVTLSLAMQVRPNALFLFPFALIFIWLAGSDSSRLNRIKSLLMFTGVFTLVSIPLLIRAIYVNGRVVFYDQSGPFVFLLSNLPDYGGVGWEVSPQYQAIIERAGGEFALTWKMALGGLMDAYVKHPLALPALYLRKLYFTFNCYEYPSNLNYYLFSNLSPLMRAPWSKFSVVSGFGFVGMAAGFSGIRDQKGRAALYLILMGVLTGVMLFYPVDRFRFPLAPLMMIFGAFGISRIFAFIIARKFGRTLLMLVAAIGIMWMLKIPTSFQRMVRPEDYLNMGWAFMENPTHTDYEKAEYYLIESWNESAARRYPINRAGKIIGPLERNLAANDIDAGNYEMAVSRLKRAESADLCNSETEQLLAMALRGMGRTEEAISAEEEASSLKETLPKERHLELADQNLSRYSLPGAYCHLLSAAVLEENADFKKQLQESLTEILVKIQTLPLDTSRIKTPEY